MRRLALTEGSCYGLGATEDIGLIKTKRLAQDETWEKRYFDFAPIRDEYFKEVLGF